MGFSLETTNYKLGQYAGTDKPNYTTDYNENMAKIDAALKSVSDAGGATNTDLGDTKDRVSALETNVATNTENIASVTATAAQNTQDITAANSKIEALQTKDTELEGDVANVKNQLAALPAFDGISEYTLKIENINLTYTGGISLSPNKESMFTINADDLPALGSINKGGFIPMNCVVVRITATSVQKNNIEVLGILPQQGKASSPNTKLLNVTIFNNSEHSDNITSITIAVTGISVSSTT